MTGNAAERKPEFATNGSDIASDGPDSVEHLRQLAEEQDQLAQGRAFDDLKQEAQVKTPDKSNSGGGDARKKFNGFLDKLKSGIELFQSEGTAYARKLDGTTFPIRSKAGGHFVRARYRDVMDGAPTDNDIRQAQAELEGVALFERPEKPVYRRVAREGDTIWIDLCRGDNSAVKVTAQGWQVVSKPDVPFVRSERAQALPQPTEGPRDISVLAPVFGPPESDEFKLRVGFVTQALRGEGSYFALIERGVNGSGKTGRTVRERQLIDPNTSSKRKLPNGERDLATDALNNFVLSFDNVSYITLNMSDTLCRIATGAAIGGRKLYTDDEEHTFSVYRPILMNSISQMALRPDLAQRAVVIDNPEISPEERRLEEEMEQEWQAIWPDAFAAILDGLAMALRRQGLKLDRRPRMADAVQWVEQAAPAFGWEDGEFLAAFERIQDTGNITLLDNNSVAAAVVDYMDVPTRRESIPMTATELKEEIERGHTTIETRKARDWPKSPRDFADELNRLRQPLGKAGIKVETHRAKGRTRWVLRDERGENE